MGVADNLSRRHFLGVAGATGVGLLAAACSSGKPSSGSASGTAAARRGGSVNIAQATDINAASLFGENSPNLPFGRLLFNTLTEYDHKTLKPQPSLAKSWQTSSDGLTVTMQLRDDVKYHSGRPFGPDDVIASVQAQVDPKTVAQLKSTAKLITDVSATGPNEVTFRLSQPASNFFDLCEIMFMIDKESLPDLLQSKNFVGTGPFKFKDYTPGSSISFTRNTQYWKPGRPYLDEATLHFITQAQAMTAALRTNQQQIAFDLDPTDSNQLKQYGFNFVPMDSQDAVYYIGCNVKVPPLDNKMFRQAISWAVNRDRVLSESLNGVGFVSSIPWAKSSPAYDGAAAGHYKHDPAKAKQLLQASGVADTTLQLAVNTATPTLVNAAQVVQFDLKQAGFNVDIVPLQQADFVNHLTNGTLPGLWMSFHGFQQVQPATLITSAFPFNASKNASNFSDPAYTALADSVWKAKTPDEAKKISGDITSYLLDQQFVVELVTSSHTWTSSNRLQNYSYSMFDYLNLDDAYLS